MKVRVGYGLTALAGGVASAQYADAVDALEGNGWDSLWLSERIGAPSFDPVTALSFAAARTQRIKLGTSVSVLPGRNPAEVAKTWATLDVLSRGRALPAFGLGVVHPNEQQAFGVVREERAARFDEMLPLVRRLWAEDSVDHDGRFFHYDGLRVDPKPTKPLDVWLGGKAPSELRRVGRLGDGWLASFALPADAAEAIPQIEVAAREADRTVDPEHYGAMVMYAHEPPPDTVLQLIASRNKTADPAQLLPVGWDAVRTRIQDFVGVGVSKLVCVPFGGVDDWEKELERGADALLDLQT
jgi:probable F420-dependent oxidoreductase